MMGGYVSTYGESMCEFSIACWNVVRKADACVCSVLQRMNYYPFGGMYEAEDVTNNAMPWKFGVVVDVRAYRFVIRNNKQRRFPGDCISFQIRGRFFWPAKATQTC